MKQTDLYNELIGEGFDQDIAVLAVMADGIRQTMKFKKKDFTNGWKFYQRLERKLAAAAWMYDENHRSLAMKLATDVKYQWELHSTLRDFPRESGFEWKPATFRGLMKELHGWEGEDE